MSTIAHTLGRIIAGFVRPFDGFTQTFDNETTGTIVDKKGFGIVSLVNTTTMDVIKFKVGHKSDLSDGVTIDLGCDLSLINTPFTTSDLAAYPFFQLISDSAITGNIIISMT